MKDKLLKILSLALLFSITACAQKTFELKGTVEGMDGAIVSIFIDGGNLQDTISGNQFHLSGKINEIGLSNIYIQQDNKFLFHQPIVLENEKMKLVITNDNGGSLTGGSYNQILFEKVKTPEYIETESALMNITNGTARLDGIKDPMDEWEGVQLFLKREDLKANYYNTVVQSSKSPELILMAAFLSNLQPDSKKIMKKVNTAATELPEDNKLVAQVRQMYSDQNKFIEVRKGINVGELYTDFTAANVKGDSIQLAPIVKKHKYTLLQFWASWCGPCRKEIPLLKKLYKSFKPKGFEIVSFSLDHNKNSWIRASELEDMSWYNISDLKAMGGDIIKNYPVRGIPANVIIDQNGKIVASNLIDEDLENIVHELFK